MTSHELLETIERLLEAEGFSQEAVNRLVLALALENRSLFEAYQKQTYRELAELRELLEKQARNVDRLAGAVERTDEYLEQHPTLLYLLRYRTKQTIVILVVIFVVLSAWTVSEFREPILRWLGVAGF
jgi:hypothetical protein